MHGALASTARPRRAVISTDVIRGAIYVVGSVPAIWTFYLGLTDQLGADPMRTLERSLGLWALRFILIGLAITPLRRLGGPNLVRYRRAVGLLAFSYAAIHLAVYVGLDQVSISLPFGPTSSNGPTLPSECLRLRSWCRSPPHQATRWSSGLAAKRGSGCTD